MSTLTPEPTTHDLIVQLRERLGLFAGAMPISPKQAWEEALALVAPAGPMREPVAPIDPAWEKQRATYDCMLAALSMAVGKPYASLWPEDFRAIVEAKHGTFGENLDRAYELAGLTPKVDFKSCYVSGLARGVVATILWGRRALIQVPSLNYEGAQHIVYWDGAEVRDPSTKQVYRWLDQITACEYVWLFNEAVIMFDGPNAFARTDAAQHALNAEIDAAGGLEKWRALAAVPQPSPTQPSGRGPCRSAFAEDVHRDHRRC